MKRVYSIKTEMILLDLKTQIRGQKIFHQNGTYTYKEINLYVPKLEIFLQ